MTHMHKSILYWQQQKVTIFNEIQNSLNTRLAIEVKCESKQVRRLKRCFYQFSLFTLLLRWLMIATSIHMYIFVAKQLIAISRSFLFIMKKRSKNKLQSFQLNFSSHDFVFVIFLSTIVKSLFCYFFLFLSNQHHRRRRRQRQA